MATSLPLYQVDAFTSVPFKGNPAAVCLLDAPLKDATLRDIAREMNLSETAFVQPLRGKTWQEAATFSLRWFTPQVEVRLCGHATLATAAVLFRELHVPSDTLTFETLSGTLAARQTELGITLDFPADDPAPYTPPEGVLEALGIETPEEVVYAAKTRKLLIRLASAGEIRALKPDFTRLKAATEAAHVQGPIVTAPGTPPYDFVSRFFAPAVGIDEDPVTGSAHTVLGPYWARRSGKTTLYAYQASARGGEVHVALLPKNRVALSGDAVVVFSGKLRVEDTGVV